MFLALVTLAAALQIDRLRVIVAAESMLERGTPAWDYLVSTEKTFGAEDLAVVVFRDPEIFRHDKLEHIERALAALKKLPYVSDTSSLFDMPNIKNIDDNISSKPFLDPLPTTKQEAESIKADALHNPLVRGNLISADGKTIAINLTVVRNTDDDDFDRTVTDGIERIISPLRGSIEHVYQVGSAAVRSELTRTINKDQTEFLPLSVGVLLLTLLFSLRRMSAVLLPLTTAGISVVWTLGFMALVGIPMNIMTSIVPALVIIIGSTEDIHLIAEYATGVREGLSRATAVDHMANNIGMAVLLTFVTTYVGFLSIAINDIQLLQQFGIAASTGLLFNFLITIMLVPVALRYFGHQSAGKVKVKQSGQWFQEAAVSLVDFALRRRLAMLVLTGVVVISAFALSTQLHINNSITDYLGQASSQRVALEDVHKQLSGVETFSIVLDSGIDNTFLQVKYLQEIMKIQKFLSDTGEIDKSYSFADFIIMMNRVMNEDYDPDFPLPEGDDIVREYMVLTSQSQVASLVSPKYGKARIIVRHNISSSAELNGLIHQTQEFIDKNIDPGLKVVITGKSVLSNRAVEEMAYGQLYSLLLVGGVIVGLVSILFVSLRAGLTALVPNLLPVVILFGVMAFFGIPLNTGTSMVAAIALGICVDDTMHVMSRFHEELKQHDSRSEALKAMIRAESVPVVATSVALAAGFAVFATSDFQPVASFGLLSTMVILIALLATFVVTPLLLSSTELLTVWDLLSYKVQKEALQKSPLFQGMRVWQIKKLLLASEVRTLSKDTRIITEGEKSAEMYVVLEGRAEAQKVQLDGAIKNLRTFNVGDLFGEVGPLSGGTRTADVVALEETQVLVLSWEQIDRLTKRFPILAFRLFRNLTQIIGARLRHTSEYRVAGG